MDILSHFEESLVRKPVAAPTFFQRIKSLVETVTKIETSHLFDILSSVNRLYLSQFIALFAITDEEWI